MSMNEYMKVRPIMTTEQCALSISLSLLFVMVSKPWHAVGLIFERLVIRSNTWEHDHGKD